MYNYYMCCIDASVCIVSDTVRMQQYVNFKKIGYKCDYIY
jgi:hypothetical protein